MFRSVCSIAVSSTATKFSYVNISNPYVTVQNWTSIIAPLRNRGQGTGYREQGTGYRDDLSYGLFPVPCGLPRTSVSIAAQDLSICGIISGLKEKRFDHYEASK